jgi:hypothetical protein
LNSRRWIAQKRDEVVRNANVARVPELREMANLFFASLGQLVNAKAEMDEGQQDEVGSMLDSLFLRALPEDEPPASDGMTFVLNMANYINTCRVD